MIKVWRFTLSLYPAYTMFEGKWVWINYTDKTINMRAFGRRYEFFYG